MANFDLLINLQVKMLENISKNVDGISQSINKLSNQKPINTLQGAFDRLGGSVVVLNQGLELARKAYNLTVNSIMKLVDAGAEQERVEVLLAEALRQKGIFTEDLLQKNLRLASSLQRLTTYGDEQIAQAQRTLIQYGVEQTQIESVTKAVLDFASAKKIDLASAADLVGRTIGTTSNSLGRYGVQIKDVTDKTARASAVISGIGNLFGGSAQAEVNTFSGAIAQLKNVYSDMIEQLGLFLVKNDFIIPLIKKVTDGFVGLQGVIESNKKSFEDTVKFGILFLINSLEVLVSTLAYAIKIFKAFYIAIDFLYTAIVLLVDAFASLPVYIEDAVNWFAKLLGYTGKLSTTFKNISLAVGIFADKSTAELLDQGESWNNLNKTVDTVKESVLGVTKSIKSLEGKKVSIDVNRNVAGTVSEDGTTSTEKAIKVNVEESFEQKMVKAATGFTSAIAQGAPGAAQAVTSALTIGLTPLLGAFAPAIAPLFDLFSKGAEFVTAAVNSFISALPSTIITIIKGAVAFVAEVVRQIPFLIESLITEVLNYLPELINFLLSELPKILVEVFFKLVELLPVLIQKIIEAIPMIVVSFITSFIERIPLIIETIIRLISDPAFVLRLSIAFSNAFIAAIPVIAENLGKAVAKAFTDALNIFKGIGTTKTSGSSQVGKKMAGGGDVPNISKYSGDRFPANLNAGEAVIEASTTKMLRDFLLSGGNSQPQNITVNLQVGEDQLATAIFNLNKQGYRTA